MTDAAVERPARAAVARPRARALTVTALGGAALFLVGALLVGTAVGPVHVGVGAIAESALSHIPFLGLDSHLSSTQDAIVWQLRFPRVILGALVGGMLALGGASYQGVFRNPLADPYLLGVAAGAGLGATLAVAYLPHGFAAHDALPPAAFAGAIVAVAIAYAIGRAASPRSSGAALVLAGVTVASFFTAVQTFVQQQHADTLQEVYSWILGSLPSSGWTDVVARTALSPAEIPIGVVTAFCGAPFFAVVLRTSRRMIG